MRVTFAHLHFASDLLYELFNVAIAWLQFRSGVEMPK
jgi:hypothetical protein